MTRALHFLRSGRLAWRDQEPSRIEDARDAVVRPFVAGRCDGDTVPIHRPVSRAMQLGVAIGAIDPVVASICGPVPFKGPFGIGHECVAEVVAVGSAVAALHVGQHVVVPWAVSCGSCAPCQRGLTSKCATTTRSTLAAFGFGPRLRTVGRHGRGHLPRPVRGPHAGARAGGRAAAAGRGRQ